MSWKRQGSSFNSLVNSNYVDKLSNPFDRHIIQTYELPDSSGSGQVATKAIAAIEFEKFDSGVNATNNQIIFENIWHGVDASASIVFEDVSGAMGFQGIRFQDSIGNGTDISQNIFITDTSGESLLLVLDVDLSLNYPFSQPIWEKPPTSIPTNIGCPSPPTLVTDASCGTLGRIRIQMGKEVPTQTDFIAQIRALQFSKAIGNPPSSNWTNPPEAQYQKIEISAESLGEINDISMCLMWQHKEVGNTTILYKPEPSPETPISHWTSTGFKKWEPDYTLFPTVQDGSFNSGRELADISQNIILKDTSGETLLFALDVSKDIRADDPSWNQAPLADASFGKIIIPMGQLWFQYPTQANILLPSDSSNPCFHPNKTERLQKFIEAVNKTWDDAPPENYIEIKAEESTDISGVAILYQMYGGLSGNTNIKYDPSFNEINANSEWLPTSETSDASFNGGTTEYDISQNLTITNPNSISVTFHLNVDLSMNDVSGNYYPPFLSSSNNVQVQMDGSLLDETNNIHNRITNEERAAHFTRAINNTPIISGFPISWGISAIRDASTVTLLQDYPGINGNGNISYDPSFAEISSNPNHYPICSTTRPFPDPSGFVGGVDPVDLSQNIILQAYESALHPVTINGEPALNNIKVLFLLDVDKTLIQDPLGPVDLSGSPAGWPSFPPGHDIWSDASFVYGINIPMGKGLGHTSQEISISDASRAYKFKEGLNIARADPLPGWTPGDSFIGGGVGFGLDEIIIPNPDFIPPRFSAGKLLQYREGSAGNLDISYNPNPNYDPLSQIGNPYDPTAAYPLKHKINIVGGNEIIYNFTKFNAGQDFLQATDKIIRTNQLLIIKGGNQISVVGDQSSNTITIESTQQDEVQAPLWTLGKGAGTGNSITYSMQARNPGMDTGLYGAGASYALAAGLNTKATGVASVSFGRETNVGGRGSFSAGELNVVPSINSLAIGYQCSAFSDYSTALGYNGQTGTDLSVPAKINPTHEMNNVIFAIGSEDGLEVDASGISHYNILELDTSGNIWTKALGNMKYQEVQWLRNKYATAEERMHSGLYVSYKDSPQDQPQVTGNRSLAAGYNTSTAANSSFVDGSNCTIEAGGDFSAVFGEDNVVKNSITHAFIAGKNNIASGQAATVFGRDCSGGNYTFTSGYQNHSIGSFSTSIGSGNVAQGDYSISLGGANYAYNESSIALGRNNRSIGFASVAIGCHCEPSGNFSVAIGRDSNVTKDSENSVALGGFCDTSGANSISLGSYSNTDGSGCFAACGGSALANYAIAIGNGSISSNIGAISIGRENKSIGESSLTCGFDCSANGNYSIAMGKKCYVDSSFCFAVGENSHAYNGWSFAFGKECDASGIGSFAAGFECKSNSFQNFLPAPLGIWPLNINPPANLPTDTLPSIALGYKGSTSLFAPWRNGIGASNNNNADWEQVHSKPGPKFRQYHKGIIFAIGASGESTIINKEGMVNDPDIVGLNRINSTDAGNIFELYGDGSIWTPDLGLLVPPMDASSSKWEYFNSGGSINDPSSALIARYRNNAGMGKGAFAAGENCIVDGSYSFCVGINNKTSKQYAVAMGVDCSGGGEASLAMGKNCDASNAYSIALGCNASTRNSKSGRIDGSGIIFAIGTCEDGNIFEVDISGGLWSKQLGKLETSTPALGAVPIGGIIPYAGSMSIEPPINWLWCDGYDGQGGIPIDATGNQGDNDYDPGNDPGLDHIQNPEYEPLFMVIGQTYGTKKDGTGFRVPNLEQRYPLGLTDFTTVSDIGDGIPTVDSSGVVDSSGTGLPEGIYHGALMRYIIRYK